MRKILLCSALTASFSFAGFAQSGPKLEKFESFSLGMTFDALSKTAKDCNAPSDSPGFHGSRDLGVSSIFCAAAETFAMATLVDQKLASLALNWVSWEGLKLDGSDQTLGRIPEELRKEYGIPNATVTYESQFGNSDSDRYCSEKAKCQMHIWKSSNPSRVASLVYAKLPGGEVPLLFQLTDLEAEQKIDLLKNRLAKSDNLSREGQTKRQF
ncbi:MAG: hypothetical protein EOP07_24110 [Proteobacteria bacterium]|nr:MAG: hypothetical protein EOP07_24110 [Pseudomonadota bacterium]